MTQADPAVQAVEEVMRLSVGAWRTRTATAERIVAALRPIIVAEYTANHLSSYIDELVERAVEEALGLTTRTEPPIKRRGCACGEAAEHGPHESDAAVDPWDPEQ